MDIYWFEIPCVAYRAQHGEAIRHACRLAPLEAFHFVGEWLQYQLSAPINTGNTPCEYYCTQNI